MRFPLLNTRPRRYRPSMSDLQAEEIRKMDSNPHVIVKNLGTFANAYGLHVDSKRLIEAVSDSNGHVERAGLLLRDPVTGRGLISCQFPVDQDITNLMLFVPIDGRPLEAVPICTKDISRENRLKTVLSRLKDRMRDDRYLVVSQGDFRLTVHESFCKRGVIEAYNATTAYGFIRRTRSGIFFMKKWTSLDEIRVGIEVSFVPVICPRKGLQARAVEEVSHEAQD